MVLIDTSSWTHALRRKGDPEIRQRVEHLLVSTEAAWCDVVRLELWNGARDNEDRESLRELESEVPCLAITADVWNIACDVASYARSRGLSVPVPDLIVFACAHVHGVAIEHHDQHYDRLDQLLANRELPGRLRR